jgi:asparagine synthase (glutamine-hydrolysing)
LKLRGGTGKRVLREVAEGLLPRELLTRHKRGFGADISGQLREQAEEVRRRLLGPAMLESGMFEAGTMAALVDRHASGAADHSQALWHLLMVEGFLAEQGAGQNSPKLAYAEA